MKITKKDLKEYLLCVVGSLLYSVGVYFFKFPNNFSTGGVSGISVVLGNYFNLSSASTISAALNALLLVLGFIFLGKECGVKTVIGTFTLSGALMLYEKLIPLSGPLTDQPLLELLVTVCQDGIVPVKRNLVITSRGQIVQGGVLIHRPDDIAQTGFECPLIVRDGGIGLLLCDFQLGSSTRIHLGIRNRASGQPAQVLHMTENLVQTVNQGHITECRSEHVIIAALAARVHATE